MSALLRFLLVMLFAVSLAFSSTAAGAHRVTYQGDARIAAASDLSQPPCSGTCEHGSAICVQLCLAQSASLTSESFEIKPMASISSRVLEASLLLTGLASPPQLLPPIA